MAERGAGGPAIPFSLRLYLALSRRAGGLAGAWLRRRQAAGKEDAARLGERMGQAGRARPDGPLIWFHAASVGESISLLEVLQLLRAEKGGVQCLVTSGTLTSAQVLAARLPAGCIHQFVPLDVLPWIERFLDHWRPDLAVWTESELWPAALWASHRRGIPMMLINARISERTYRRWLRAPALARALFGRFDTILAQDELASRQIARLGAPEARLSVSGSLKEGAAPLPCDEAERKRIARAVAARPVWLAASTHEGEEAAVLEAHRTARRSLPGLMLILAPRHPERGGALARMFREAGLNVTMRSADEPLGEETDVYLADTLGEMGLWYRIAPVSFIGGSLREIGGHNPYEPALLGSAILHGPHVRNFAGAYARLTEAGAAIEVRDGAALGAQLADVMAPDKAAKMAAAGWEVCSESAEVTDLVLREIRALLPAPG